MNRICALFIGLLLASLATISVAQDRLETRVFFFGNSLINHLSDTPQTATPYWLNHLARVGGQDFRSDGVFGFLRDFTGNLPPEPNWQFPGLRSAWDADRQRFGAAKFDTVVLNPANFIQFQPATAKYPDSTTAQSPLSATLNILDWVHAESPDTRILIYEGWADLESLVPFPPNAQDMQAYHKANMGAYHQWYLDYVAELRKARPHMQIDLLPVAHRMSEVLSSTAYKDLTSADLYLDAAPHGTPNLYLIAAMVSYDMIFGTDLPSDPNLPESITKRIRNNYDSVRAFLRDTRLADTRPKIAPVRIIARPTTPSMGMGLNAISDWSTQYPFIDLMKSARPWVGHKPGQWGGMDAFEMLQTGLLSPDGWPLRMPDGIERIESFILTELPTDADYFHGRYRLSYDGSGIIEVLGQTDNKRRAAGEIWFDYVPGEGLVTISIKKIDPADPIRNIRVIKETHLGLDALGARFNPDWLALVQDFRVLRFMDWMMTNGSPIETWEDRPLVADYTYAWRGVPAEVMVDLANQVGADPWFNMPHLADDAFVEHFATLVRDRLDPSRKAFVEYSNELWNFIFPQTQWALDASKARWPRGNDDRWMQFAGMRAAQVADIWTKVFGADADNRLTRVIAVHTGWPGLEEPLLNAPLWQKEDRNNNAPSESFDAYAVTGYFGHGLGSDEFAPQVLDWLKISESEALKRSYKMLKSGSVQELTTELFPYHAKVAAQNEMALIMYEGGTHVEAHDGWRNDETLVPFFTELNYTSEIAALYAEVIEGFEAAGGVLFNAFVDVATPSQWGSWGAKRHLNDRNPRWDTLVSYNSQMRTDWEPRNAGHFANGLTLLGGTEDELLEGTDLPDMMDGADGDDWFIAGRGPDRVHGGDGLDTVVLPGAAPDYSFAWEGSALIAVNAEFETLMISVEQVEFADEPGQVYAISAAN